MSETDEPEGIGLAALTKHPLIVILATAAGLAAGYWYFQQQKPVYKSSAAIMVTEAAKAIEVDGLPDANSTARRQENLVERIRGREFLIGVVRQKGLLSLPVFEDLTEAEAANKLIGRLTVRPRKQTDVIEMSYIGATPGETEAVLSAVVTGTEEDLTREDTTAAALMVEQITTAKDELLRDIEAAEKEYQDFVLESGLIRGAEGTVNPYAERQAAIESRRNQLVIDRAEAAGQLKGIREAIARGGTKEALTLLVEMEAQSGGNVKSIASIMADRLLPLEIEREILTQTEGLGIEHPDVRAVDSKIALTKARLQEMAGAESAGGTVDLIDAYVESLEQRIATIDSQIQNVGDLAKEEEKAAKDLVATEFREQQLRSRIENSKRLFDAVIGRLSEANLTSQMADTEFRLLNRPEAGVKTPLHRERYLALGGLAGLALGGLLGFMLEASDKRFRTAQQIERVAGAPVIGHIPKFRVTAGLDRRPPKGVSGAVVVSKHPSGEVAEAYRFVRTVLASGLSEGENVIQVTSANSGDGKSLLAANMGAAFAANGKRTVIVECDLRKPTMAKLFPFLKKHKDGLTSNLGRKNLPLEEVTYETGIPNLSIVPCGKKPANPAEVLSGMAFDAALSTLRDEYDVVVVDAPPLLAVADAAILAPKVDGQVFSLRLGKHARENLANSIALLRQNGGRLLGVVVNWANERAAGQYQYGKAGSYGYKANSKYYKAAKPTKKVAEELGI